MIRPRWSADLACPFCHGPIGPSTGPEDAVRTCTACGARHHRECMALHGGCAVHGCEPRRDDMTDGWTIDPDDPVPLGDQIVYRVLYAIARDVYQAGDRVPTVRDVATRLRVNPNTVSKAYRDLERDGVLVSRRGAGVFVSEAGPGLARERRQALVLDRFDRAVRDALDAGLSPVEIEDVLAQALVTAARARRSPAPIASKTGDDEAQDDDAPRAARSSATHDEEV